LLSYQAVVTAINNNDLASAKAHYTNYKTLLDAAGLGDDINRMMKSVGKDALVTNTYASLYDDKKGNFVEMSNWLENPDNQKNAGLTLSDAFEIKAKISAAQADKDRSDKIRYDKGATAIYLNLPKMTNAKIDLAVTKDEIPYQLGEHFKAQKKALSEGGASDASAYFRLYQEIHAASGDPDAMRAVRQKVIGARSVSFSDRKTLVGLTESDLNTFESRITLNGAKTIAALTKPSETLTNTATPQEVENFTAALNDYHNEINKRKKELATQNKSITEEDINKIAKTVTNSRRMTMQEQNEAFRKQSKIDMEKYKQKKNGISPARKLVGYNNGKPVYDNGDGTWTRGN